MNRPYLALAVSACALTLSCAGEPTLPDGFHGRWYYQGSSGGLAGDTFGEADGSAIEIGPDNAIEHYDPDGRLVGTETITVRRGPSIFGSEDAWIIESSGGIPRVASLNEDGSMSLADNVYDGFSSRFTRTQR